MPLLQHAKLPMRPRAFHHHDHHHLAPTTDRKEERVPNFLSQWFAGGDFLPHGHGDLWTPGLLWIHLIADLTTGIAFYSIPLALMYFVRSRRELDFNCIFALLSVFMFACGTTHFVSIWAIWHPGHWLDAAVRALAAIASVVAATLLWPVMTRVLRLPSKRQLRNAIDQLEHEIAERRRAEEALRQSQETLRELAAHQERIREDERKRIAREIHDELGQNLLALRLDVSTLHMRAGERRPLLRERAANALEQIDTTMKSIRTIMNNLRPAVLDLGLHAAIEWQVKQFERRNGIPCELLMSDDGEAVPDAQATAVFRILQESLTNIGRHSRASYVRIELRVDHRRLSMAIKDNGIGIFPSDRHKVRRFGLVGIQERVVMLSGELDIDSTPGKGTVLRLSVPLPADGRQTSPTYD
jgi:signal transduction histidine kinase